MITHVLADEKDPRSFQKTKPIGPVYKKKINDDLKYEEGRGWRKFVSSPIPIDIVEKDEIVSLLEKGFIVVACGGGGIPMLREKTGMKTMEGVIDKDRASAVLAKKINADLLLILTDVPCAYINFGKKYQKPIKQIDWKEARKLLNKKEFGQGNMAPKIEAAIDFSRSRKGRKTIICSLDNFKEAIKGKEGTTVV